jgi:hydrogenase maturation protease
VGGVRVLVAGVGNIFLGDDAFGVEVARRLIGRPQPDGVRVVDFGIRGFDLAYALMDGPDLAILVDATPRGGPPGTLYVLEPDEPGPEYSVMETHGMNPERVLQMVRALGGQVPPLRVVGCEPATLGSEEDPAMGLSQPVQAAVDEAVRLVESIVAQFCGGADTAAEPGIIAHRGECHENP